METKAIFLDVDGTLVSFDTHRVPQSAIEALQQVHESGIKIIIATGRAFTDLHELEEIPYDAVIALNGADCVLRDGTPISRKQIPEKDFQRVLVLAQHYGFALAIETNKGIFVNELNPTVIELARLVNHPTPPVADIEKEFMGGECCQLCIYCDEEMEKEVMAQLPGLSVSRWNPFFADVNVAGVNKAMGINEFASYYGFDVSPGRAPNDYLRMFGAGPVMVNIGINGLIGIAYVLLVGGDLNGPTLGGIFTIMGFSAFGKHPRNIIPVMFGVWLDRKSVV